MGKVAPIVFALLTGVLLARNADAQSMRYSVGGYAYREDPAVNVALSARYDHLLQVSRRFRSARVWKECHIINWPALHGDCIASFDQYEPVLPEYWRS
jgi:hypothetical protein